MNRQQSDPRIKAVARRAYRVALALLVMATFQASGRFEGTPRVFYGGARPGDVGGPLVKVKRLQAYFPQHLWTYNLVYLLSNAPYLPGAAIGLLKGRGVPLVLNQNGVFYPGWYDGDWRGQNAIMAEGYHKADHVFWQSDFCRRAANQFLGERAGPGEVLFNAVDIDRFSPPDQPRDTGGPFRFLLTGKIGAHLAYRLVSTIAGLSIARASGLDAQLIVAGWTAPEAKAAALAKAEAVGLPDDAVAFTGPYTQAEAPAIYHGADAYVMTKYLDPCPNTVLEAMACGLPIVFSASGGVPELVGADAGVGVPVPEAWDCIHEPDTARLGEAMLAVAEQRDGMGRAARARAEACFDIRTWIARHRAVFLSLLEHGNR